MGQRRPDGEVVISAPTIERGRRCENCRHYDTGTLAIQHYKSKRMAELKGKAREIFERGAPIPGGLSGKRLGDSDIHSIGVARSKDAVERGYGDIDVHMRALGMSYSYGDELIRTGQAGLCRLGVPGADFVQGGYFCGAPPEGRYEPKVVVEDAHKHDETPDEARERLGYTDRDE